jgi:copper chaperone
VGSLRIDTGWLRGPESKGERAMYELKVSGMSCSHCAAAITRSIRRRDPEAKVEVDVGAGRVSVESVRSEAEVRQAVEEEGYRVLESARP